MEKTATLVMGRILRLFLFFIQPLVNLFASSACTTVWKGKVPQPGHNTKLRGGELQIVMERVLGTYRCYQSDGDEEEEEEEEEVEELPQLFDEEPSLEEIKAAFDVFDENKDGFIDAVELQRVLRSLSLKEGSRVEDCRKMIKPFDEDDDGQIDFKEFVKFLEKCFY